MKYRRKVGSLEARVRLSFSYPLLQPSLRSGLGGIHIVPAVTAALGVLG